MNLQELLASQLANVPPVPTQDFSNQVIIVTGGNTGLGLEAARHLVRLNAAKVILTARDLAKGAAAVASIEASTNRPPGVVELHELDLSSYASVQKFAAEISRTQPRIDGLLANAGMLAAKFELVEGNESTLTVNVVSTMLLAVLLLPALRRSAAEFHTEPRISFVCSGTHIMAEFPEWTAPSVFAALNDAGSADMQARYPLSKLLLLLAARELVARMRPTPPTVVVNLLNPGLCHSDLDRDLPAEHRDALAARKAKFARSTEEGGRTLVHAIAAGPETQGKLMNDCAVSEEAVSSFARSEDGAIAQQKVWAELAQKLEAIEPGCMNGI